MLRDHAVARALAHVAKDAMGEFDSTMDGGELLIIDGPFLRARMSSPGSRKIDVADLDEALRLVESWPACPLVKIRPITG